MESTAITTSATTTSKYVRDFEALFAPVKAAELRNKALNGNLSDCQFRSLCWSYFLHCLPAEYDHWLAGCKKNRQAYEEIKAKHSSAKNVDIDSVAPQSGSSVTPTNLNETPPATTSNYNKQQQDQRTSDNNLASVDKVNNKEIDDEQQYIRASNQCDYKNVFRTIERDVIRTFPDMEFFRRTEMQTILKDVLFNFASENTHLSYKQGMHELLAILLYVVHTDSQNCLINYEGGYANDTIATLLNLKYLEHDVFHLFSALMKSIETWYQNDDPVSVSQDSRSNKSDRQSQIGSFLGVKLNKISENIVKKYDLELFNHLEALQIAPQIYGIRWMRLLFSREFEFFDLLTIWDAIICDEVSMSLTEYIFASMLITIRNELVNGDYTDCLNNLMRHQFKDVQYVIKLALHLREPRKNPRPRMLQSHGSKHLNQSTSYNIYSTDTSLARKLSQQYISGSKQQNLKDLQTSLYSSNNRVAHESARQNYSPKMNDPSNIDSRDSRKIFMTSKPHVNDRQRSNYHFNSLVSATSSSGTRSNSQTNRSASQGVISSTNKFLPNINKLVSSIGQNIQDKAINQSTLQSNSKVHRSQQRFPPNPSHGLSNSAHLPQQYHNRSSNELILLASSPIKEYEMREIQSSASSSNPGQASRFPIGNIRNTDTRSALNLSAESYDDLHSIVDYCWRLLSEQIDSLQRCLPKEKSLHSEDEIFVALAQLKKVRDVLKGSLRLEDELDSPTFTGKTLTQ